MTHKRSRESLGRLLHEPCFYCDGTGQLMTALMLFTNGYLGALFWVVSDERLAFPEDPVSGMG